MQVFAFDIETTTHDLMKEGITAGRFFGAQQNHQRVIVAAETRNEAAQIAIQIGFCFGYVTACYDRI